MKETIRKELNRLVPDTGIESIYGEFWMRFELGGEGNKDSFKRIDQATERGLEIYKQLIGTNEVILVIEEWENSWIKVAQAEEFIMKLDNKYDSHIAQGGTNISGGQKQRISIARAIAREPEIYIFDDSFSALDYKTDSQLRKELKKYTKDATTLIVAQRIGTIMNADKIVVLDKGVIVGIGKHKELLKNCDVYKEIAYSQLSKEELENG